MRRPEETAPAVPLPRALLGGAVGAVASVALVITLGVLAFAPAGPAGAAVGITASFLGVVVSATVFALLSGARMPAGGPTSATTLLLATLVAQLAASPAGPVDAADPALTLAAIWVATGAAVVTMGLAQVLMGLAGLGRLVRFVPQPVLAGFMLGVALLIVLAQLPALLALDAGALADTAGWPAAAPAALLFGLGSALLIQVLLRWRPRWPAALLALALAALVQAALSALAPDLALGDTLAPVRPPASWPGPAALLAGGDAAAGPALLSLLWVYPGAIALTGLLMALIGSLEALLHLRVLDQHLHTRHDGRRELIAMGAGNLVGGCLGALPVVMLRARAMSILQAGGLGRPAALAAAAASLLLVLVGGPVLALLPLAALAGVMLTVAWALVDPWLRRMAARAWQGPRDRALWQRLLVVLVVALLTVMSGPAAGVAAGVVLATVGFVRGLHSSLLRWRGDAALRPSRRVYPPAQEALLQPLRPAIAVLELEGALFWGNAERLASEAERLPPATRFLVLDLRRVGAADETAAVELQLLEHRLADRGIALLLAGPPSAATGGRTWSAFVAESSGAAPPPSWPDADRATEHAERCLLGSAPGAPPAGDAVAARAGALFEGLGPAERRRLAALLHTRTLRRGEPVFAAGDPADTLFLLTRGSVSVMAAAGTRYVSFSAGTMFGELALLDGGLRSADALADDEVELQALDRAALDRLQLEEPALAARIYRNIAAHLAQRLRRASAAWQEAAG